MGRYTSVAVFSDNRTKVVNGYKEGPGGAAPKAARPEKVETVMGSNTGAGSCEFHIYRAARSRELMRLETIENTVKQAEESAVFAAKVEANKRTADERTKKNAEKRKRRKQKQQKKAETTSGDDEGEDEDEEKAAGTNNDEDEMAPAEKKGRREE